MRLILTRPRGYGVGMPDTYHRFIDGIHWDLTVDTDNQTLTAVAHEAAGDFRLEVPLDFAAALRDGLNQAMRDRPDLFPLTSTRAVD